MRLLDIESKMRHYTAFTMWQEETRHNQSHLNLIQSSSFARNSIAIVFLIWDTSHPRRNSIIKSKQKKGVFHDFLAVHK